MSEQQASGSKASLAGFILYLAITAAHAWYLYGFLPVAGLIFLSLIGGILFYFGLKKLVNSVFTSPIKVSSIMAGLFVFGFGFLTLLPGWPDSLLLKTSLGWPLLEYRIELLDRAMYEDNLPLLRKIAWAGVGDPEPRVSSGRPLIDDAKNPEMLRILLDSGLNPDARSEGGTTLLMRTHDEAMARVLLASGANPNARDDNGRTPLMHAHTNLELMKVLAENGAEVNAVDDFGRTVADWLGSNPDIENVLGQYARSGIRRSTQVDLLSHARQDWLEQKDVENESLVPPSAISVNPDPMAYGDLAELQIRLSNDSDTDRVIKVEAMLDTDVLFVETSHDGKIINPYQPQLTQKIGWPLLALPARGSGVLSMNIITRDRWDASEASVDVRARNVLNHAEEEPFFLHFQLPLPEPPAYTGFSVGNFLAALVIPLPIAILVGTWRYLGKKHPATRGVGRFVAGMWSVGFALFVYSDVTNLMRPYTDFEATEARILDRRYYLESTTTSVGSTGRSRSYTTTISPVPIMAVRYPTLGGEVISTGSPGSYDFRELKLGAVVPCWYDPEHPNKFVLSRGIGFFNIIWIGILSIGSLVLAWVALRWKTETAASV